MTNIQVWGDSWGEPTKNYIVEGFSPEGHTSNRLIDLGYNVENIASSGHGNLVSITTCLRGNTKLPKADWIIWFHTEIPRDINITEDTEWNYTADVPKKANEIYKLAKLAQDKMGAKLIVIEGQSKVVEPHFSKVLKPELLIKDWRGELLGREMPYCQVIACPQLLNTATDPMAVKLDILNDVEFIIHSMKFEDKYFNDNCHPNNEAHRLLTERIHNFIQNYK